MTGSEAKEIIHASSVSIAGRAVLITGRSGTGKSALALDLISRGADLVADDRTRLEAIEGAIIASVPKALAGKIEARNVGILAAPATGPQIVALIVDLDKSEPNRLPEMQKRTVMGVEIDLICGKDQSNLAPAIHLYLRGGRRN